MKNNKLCIDIKFYSYKFRKGKLRLCLDLYKYMKHISDDPDALNPNEVDASTIFIIDDCHVGQNTQDTTLSNLEFEE